MGTTTYFEEDIVDALSDEPRHLEIGTSSAAGNGPQMYIRLGEEFFILGHEDAKPLCEAVEAIAHYFGYSKR